MATLYWYLRLTVGILSVFGLGALYGQHTAKPLIITQIQTVEKQVKGDTKIVFKDRIVTKTIETTKKPDGTVITKEIDKTEDKTKDTDKQVVKNIEIKTDKTTEVASTTPDKNYMVGVYKGVKMDLSVKPSIEDGIGVQVGCRLGTFDSLDVWVTGGFNNLGSHSEATVGIAITF